MEEKGKKLGLTNLVGIGLGGAIGTGIFVLLGFGIAYTGRSIVLVVAAGCFYMLLAYWYQFAMTTMFVFKGGTYSMQQLLFNPLMTGASAWMAVIGAFSYSSYAVALADYFVMVVPRAKGKESLVAFVVMTIFFMFTIGGSRIVTLIENWVTWLLLAAIALFLFFGLPKVNFGTFFASNGPEGKFFFGGFGGFIAAVSVMGWACQGTTGPVAFAPVIENPKKLVPKSILIVNVLLAIIYGLMAFVAAGVLPYEQVAGANISVTAQAIMPGAAFTFFVVGGGIGAIASSVLGGIGGMRYPLIAVADDGWLPAIFKKQTKNGYPYVTFAVFYLIAIFPIVTGMAVDAIVSLIMIPSMIMCVYLNIQTISLPEKFPEQWEKRSIKMGKGFFKVCCVLGVIASGIVAYQDFVDLNMADMVKAVVVLAVMFGGAWIRMKQGAVSKEMLDERKAAVVAEALEQ